ncbi:hypothetical protein HYS97_00795 [Candidatus Daviesbacteria bacterium]|nr:hypothetical protein [Candidatus Daviesbacteria bacterium]
MILLLVELLVLFISSKILINSIAKIIFKITKSREVVVHFLAFIFLPGTIVHELAHVVSAGVLLVPTGEIEFIPEVHEGGVKLGSAEIGKTDPLRRMLIGVAPVLFGFLTISGLVFYSINNLQGDIGLSSLYWALIIYVIFVIGNTMFSSKKDLEGSLGISVLLLGIVLSIYFLGFREPFRIFSNLIENSYRDYIFRADMILAIPLILNMGFIILAKLIHSRIHR